MNLVQKIEEWLEEEVKSLRDMELELWTQTHHGRQECAEGLLNQIKKWKKELGLKDTFENDKEIVKCGGCEQSAEIGENFSKEDWTYPWIDIPLCDDCHTDVRVEIATKFGIDNWGRIDL